MMALGQDIVAGLKDPKTGQKEDPVLIIRELPIKKHPPLHQALGTQGWGLHVTMGFSCRRFLWWMASGIALCFVYAILWFHFVSNTQVTTALAPPGLFLATLSLVLSVLQKNEESWHHPNSQLQELSTTGTGTELPKESSPTQTVATIQEELEACPSSSTAPAATLMRPEPAGVPNFSRRRIHTQER